jgi:CREB3 regulatory factor
MFVFTDDQLGFLIDTVSPSRKEKTYFWQYNTQSKGPKGKRLCKAVQDENPYVLHDFEDPVFDAELQVRKYFLVGHME